MANFSLDCPHCLVKNTSFTVRSTSAHPHQNEQHWMTSEVWATCNACGRGVTNWIKAHKTMFPKNLESVPGNITNGMYISLGMWKPKISSIDMPPHLPLTIERTYKEGCMTLQANHFDSSCNSFRRALELGLKELSPEVDAWRLERRIDHLAEKHLITPAIKEWTHQIRVLGNEATHEGEATKAEAEQMHNLCKFILTYIYSLPTQVELAREKEL
jgi:Domain of unknown function (DUF4145)